MNSGMLSAHEGVKTQLVVYPNEGHGFRDPAHRVDVLERALNWFADGDARAFSLALAALLRPGAP